jgi:hypothetical protein
MGNTARLRPAIPNRHTARRAKLAIRLRHRLPSGLLSRMVNMRTISIISSTVR